MVINCSVCVCLFYSGLGSIIGLLKVGSKNLFMFDETGIHYQLKPRCILDFYIHESRQRMGLGNLLYQHMLTVSLQIIDLVHCFVRTTKSTHINVDSISRKNYGLNCVIVHIYTFVKANHQGSFILQGELCFDRINFLSLG